MAATLTIIGLSIVLYLILGFCTLLVFYSEHEVEDINRTMTGVVLIWPFVWLFKAWRGIVYLVRAMGVGFRFVRSN